MNKAGELSDEEYDELTDRMDETSPENPMSRENFEKVREAMQGTTTSLFGGYRYGVEVDAGDYAVVVWGVHAGSESTLHKTFVEKEE